MPAHFTVLDHLERSHRTTDLLERLPGAADAERHRLVEQLIELNLGVARSVARRYHGRGIEGDDLDQVAYLALTRAAARFDPERHTDFLSYAVPCIRGEVRKHFRDHGWTVRPPRRVQELQGEITSTQDELAQRLGRPPGVGEIAEALGVRVGEVVEAQSADGCFHTASLDRPVGTGDGARTAPLSDLLGQDEPGQHEVEARVVLAPLVRRLSERDRRVLELRFFEDRTQQEIGDEIGVTQMHVSRMLTRILGELREGIGTR